MFRRVFFLFCPFAFAVLFFAGCGGSPSKTSSGSGAGPGSGPQAAGACAPGGAAAGYGYNNRNGSVSGVWVQTPAPGDNPGNVVVNATAYASAPITQWSVCLDGNAVYQANNTATTISQPISMGSGQHLLWATVTDSKGDSNRSEVRLVQVGPPPPATTVLPTPPPNAQVLTQMQNNTPDWSICSDCAAGTNNTSNFWMHFSQNKPSLSGSSLEMYADGPSWTNVLFKDIIPGTTPNTHFLWDFWIYHDPALEAHYWSSEMDFYVVLSGNEFMIGSQCDFGDGYWATWDSQGDRWVLNGIACPHWSPGWHHVQWYMERLNATQYRYDTLVFDGTGYGINQTWTVNTTTWPDQVGLQYQLDQDTSGTPLPEWVDKVTLTMW
jgi:hypothetical protein